MKKYIIGLVATAALVAPSCNTLDVDPTGNYSESTAYASLDNLDLYIKQFYTIYHNIADIETGKALTAVDDGCSDLLKSSWYNVEGGCWNKIFFQDNYVTVESNFRSNWGTMYTHIRRFNEFLDDVDKGMVKLNGEEVAKRIAETRFLRAFAYQELATRHGGVILRINESGRVDDHRDNNKARATTEATWKFIMDEYDAAAHDLPDAWLPSDKGRATKGAAYAMMARAALQAGLYDESIKAATKVIDGGVYTLVAGDTPEAYQTIFDNPANPELIIPVYFEVSKKQHSWNMWVCPPGDAIKYDYKGQFGAAITPTEEYASQFDIKVGNTWEAFDWAKHSATPFANRDPRFYASILYNGATWKDRKIQCYQGGDDECMTYNPVPSQDNVHRSTTGYYIRKFLTAKEFNYTNILSDMTWIEMRLAEVYLIRSEAYARNGNWPLAYTDLNAIRTRAGLDAKSTKSSWDEYLKDLSKERVCELGLEGKRFDDLVRWGKAQEVLNGTRLHGISVSADGTYKVIEVDNEDRKFPAKYNIYPIPYNEVQNNPLCEQNDAWK